MSTTNRILEGGVDFPVAGAVAAAHARINYRALAEFRFALRKFMSFSEAAAAKVGLTPQQHQALLAVQGLSQNGTMSIGELATYLLLRHHSVVELADRLVRLGLLIRVPDAADRRRVQVCLTRFGEDQLRELSAVHLRELQQIESFLSTILTKFGRD